MSSGGMVTIVGFKEESCLEPRLEQQTTLCTRDNHAVWLVLYAFFKTRHINYNSVGQALQIFAGNQYI